LPTASRRAVSRAVSTMRFCHRNSEPYWMVPSSIVNSSGAISANSTALAPLWFRQNPRSRNRSCMKSSAAYRNGLDGMSVNAF